MKYFCLLILIITATVSTYPNPIMPSIHINEFGFDDKGWVIELSSIYWNGNTKLYLVSNSDTSEYFRVKLEDASDFYYIITNDSVNNSFYVNPLEDRILVCDSIGNIYSSLVIGVNPGNNILPMPKTGQSICLWVKPLGKTFYYLDNTPTYGFKNDSLGAMGCLKGIVKDSSGKPLPDLKIFYDYETLYGGGDIYVMTDDSGYFFINHFAECVTLKFKGKYFFSEQKRIQIYPDSTEDIQLVINTIISSIDDEKYLPGFVLEQNYPNPFNPATNIKYTIPPAVNGVLVTLTVYDILGNEIVSLVNEEQSTGEYEVEFAAAGSLSNISSGIYFYIMDIKGYKLYRKMCLMK